ncbi:MAG: trypsin-like peptidase domain-containing protein [Lachnospiraceae bacterium]|nr:trypsin-like peptidase domain-containing protein [Lachnospiraceae bacterium]
MYDNNYPNDYSNHTGSEQTGIQTGKESEQRGIGYRSYQNAGNRTGSGTYGQSTGQNLYGNGSAYAGNSASYQGNGSAYHENTGSYHYGSAYSNDYAHMKLKEEKKPKERKRGSGYLKKAIVAVSLGLVFGLFAGFGLDAVYAVTGMRDKLGAVSEETQSAPLAAAEADTELQAPEDVPTIRQSDSATMVVTDVTEVVKNVMPSIVAVNNHYTETMSWFGQSMNSEADSSGSGIIVGLNDSELLIVSNYHVVADTDKLTVQFNEGSEAEAFIKGQDSKMDLAVIAVPVTELSDATLEAIEVATLGDSDALEVGEPAIAIGNSLGYGQSVTTGVISALDRSISLSASNGYGGDIVEGTFIQTDAAINPGNSGGALLNIKGEVIGINSNKIGGSAVEGMGYAIPISSASPIIAELMLKETKSKVAEEERGYLGISGISVTEEVSQAYGMPEGVYIAQIYPDTAAAAVGLKQGDIITEFGGDKIRSMDELQKELEFYAKGDTVEVKVMTMTGAGYEEVTKQLTLGNKVSE